MSSIFTKLKKFLGKHADELAGVTNVLGTLVSALPIDPQEKRAVRAVLDKLNNASESIAASAADMKDEAITFTDDQVNKAIAKYLASEKGRKQLAAAIKDAARPAPASFGN